jgi:uncharacterized FAD-dependent dehydrogenase
MVLIINGLALSLGEREHILATRIASLLGLPEGAAVDFRVMRKSIDARRARPPRFIYLVRVRIPDGLAISPRGEAGITVTEEQEAPDETAPSPTERTALPEHRPVIAGCGPAGIFAALTLALKGRPVLLLDRGKAVTERILDVHSFWQKGVLNSESNVHFGEGGAGTFSDGKLTSRVKNPYIGWIKRTLVEMGAPAEILIDARPHIGTDRLRVVVDKLRDRLISLGCEVRFGAKVTDFNIRRSRLVGVVINGRDEIPADHLILATGQSADDTYQVLAKRGVAMAAKAFAVGLRVEHPQELIDRTQYGRWAGHADLPPADYQLTAKVEAMDRFVYAFCMCPGGQVIGCSALPGGVITNGMSLLKRNSPYANSAVVVNVRVEDFGGHGPLAGLAFRRHWEEQAFAAGGGTYYAPVQRLTDFMADREESTIGGCSFLPGVRAARLRHILPPFVAGALKQGFREFERKMPGFVSAEAMLIGVETRTSSPVRIIRGEDGQSTTVAGLFPCGEGAGYAGGIISSALDGIRAAQRLAISLG